MPLDLTTLPGDERAKLAKEKWSPYMRAKFDNDAKGRKTLVCPFGCDVEDHDAQNNCRHLVGYATVAQREKHRYEPLVRLPSGRRVVRCRMRPVSTDVKSRACARCKRQIWTYFEEGNVVCAPCGERLREDDPAYVVQEEVAMQPVLEKMLPDDQTVLITDTYRIYRSDSAQREHKKAKGPEQENAQE